MPKRKHKDSDISALAKKLKKLDKKIRKQRRRRISSSSDDATPPPAPPPPSPPPTPPLVSNNLEDEPNHQGLERSVQAITSPAATRPVMPAPCCLDSAAPDTNDDDVNVDTIVPEYELNTEILEILGENPTTTVQYGTDIHREIAARLQHTAVNGLDKEMRKDLCMKYLTCKNIGAPKLNGEIKIALSENIIKRDKGIEARQKQIAAAISCLAEALSKQLTEKTKNHTIIKSLTDASKLMCDIQYGESTTRRNFALFAVKPEMKEALTNTKIDSSLFGEDLSEALKTAKAVTKSGSELKVPTLSKGNKSFQPLNWKTPAGVRAQPPAPRRNAPYNRPTTAAPPPPPRRYGGPPPPPPPSARNRPYHGNSSRPPQHLHRPTRR